MGKDGNESDDWWKIGDRSHHAASSKQADPMPKQAKQALAKVQALIGTIADCAVHQCESISKSRAGHQRVHAC